MAPARSNLTDVTRGFVFLVSKVPRETGGRHKRRPAVIADLDFLLIAVLSALLTAARVPLALILLTALSGFVALLLLARLGRVLALLALIVLVHVAHQ
jgi:hypothetical protein